MTTDTLSIRDSVHKWILKIDEAAKVTRGALADKGSADKALMPFLNEATSAICDTAVRLDWPCLDWGRTRATLRECFTTRRPVRWRSRPSRETSDLARALMIMRNWHCGLGGADLSNVFHARILAGDDWDKVDTVAHLWSRMVLRRTASNSAAWSRALKGE